MEKPIGPFVIAFIGTMPGAPESELLDTKGGFKTWKEAEDYAMENPMGSIYGEIMTIESWNQRFWKG